MLALVTARGGSKRIPGKNLRPLGGQPLITWSLRVASGIDAISDVMVSTDDAAIAETALATGALVPWLRPAELATDGASSIGVCMHALDWYERERGRVDGLLVLQPTSPFRSRDTVLRGVELFERGGFRTVIGVAPARSHPLWCFRIDAGVLSPYVNGDGLTLRSQDLPPAYVINGAIYLIGPKTLREQGSFFGENTLPLIIEHPRESIDIDTEWDWELAEFVAAKAAADRT